MGLSRVPEAGVAGSRPLAKGQAGLGLPPGVGLGARRFSALGLGVPLCKVEPEKGASPRVLRAASGAS